MIGLGTDVVDVNRFRRVLDRTPGIAARLFRKAEREYADLAKDPAERYAVRFAAKEAVMKALGVGLGEINMVDIEVVRAESGKPSLALHGTAAELAAAQGVSVWQISLSHTDQVAQAVVIALGAGRMP
jgi:holo-[acyl-carrier protein] synthase